MDDSKALSKESEDKILQLVDSLENEVDLQRENNSSQEDCDSLEFEEIDPFVVSTNTPTLDETTDREGTTGEQPPNAVTPDESELQGMTEEEKAAQREIWQQELAQIEEEIQTLKPVLLAKQKASQELKRKLGISVWKELTDDLSQGVRNVKESNVYHHVEQKFSQLGKAVADAPIYQKTESVMRAASESTRSIIGGLTGGFTQKIGQLKNSESFRSLEEKVGSAYENVKTKVSSSRSSSVQSFNEALREETANRTTNVKSPTSPAIPEGKQLS